MATDPRKNRRRKARLRRRQHEWERKTFRARYVRECLNALTAKVYVFDTWPSFAEALRG